MERKVNLGRTHLIFGFDYSEPGEPASISKEAHIIRIVNRSSFLPPGFEGEPSKFMELILERMLLTKFYENDRKKKISTFPDFRNAGPD